MATYDCGVILFMVSLCWGSAPDPATEICLDGRSTVKEQSCPTWYLAMKHNAVSKCVCGTTLEGVVRCDEATLEALIIADTCMSYDDTINDTVVGRCPFNYHYHDIQTF